MQAEPQSHTDTTGVDGWPGPKGWGTREVTSSLKVAEKSRGSLPSESGVGEAGSVLGRTRALRASGGDGAWTWGSTAG